MKHLPVLCAALLGLSISIHAADITFDMRQNYIQTYGKIAIQEMNRSGIPASIILAQGILESQWGQGDLAINGNNHFGIKCHDWTGESYLKEDDDYVDGQLIKSCFRTYQDALKSYKDHTDFLLFRDRYQKLFNYDKTDYVNWAKGLQECGYATDKKYPEKLIRIIEENDLAIYDKDEKNSNLNIFQNNEIDFNYEGIAQNEEVYSDNSFHEEIEIVEEELIWEFDEEYVDAEPNNNYDGDIQEESQLNIYFINNKNSYKNRIQELSRPSNIQINRR